MMEAPSMVSMLQLGQEQMARNQRAMPRQQPSFEEAESQNVIRTKRAPPRKRDRLPRSAQKPVRHFVVDVKDDIKFSVEFKDGKAVVILDQYILLGAVFGLGAAIVLVGLAAQEPIQRALF